jgi:hypothetical protein
VTRVDEFERVCALAGLQVIDPGDGWPGRTLYTRASGEAMNLLVHAAPLTTHSRGIEGEVRVQPPGQERPVQAQAGWIPLILAPSTEGILVGVSAERQIGRSERWTVTFRESLVRQAVRMRWAMIERPIRPAGHEVIHAFDSALFPAYVELVANGVRVDPDLLTAAIEGAGLAADPDDQAAAGRARRATTQLVRDAVFGKQVREAYGDRCALCDLGLGLVVGAHILPVAAPGSPDQMVNGICLCENHHRAFDQHLIYIDPATTGVQLHPDLLQAAETDISAEFFVQRTKNVLAPPLDPSVAPSAELLRRRYEYYEGSYDWVQQ